MYKYFILFFIIISSCTSPKANSDARGLDNKELDSTRVEKSSYTIRCKGIVENGDRCKRIVKDSNYCWQHK